MPQNEYLYIVDHADNIIGYEEKNACHDGHGKLHRAFSIFIFNKKKELLMQKRSRNKRLWPMYWSNSCCSHPKLGEEYETSLHRCLKNELNIDTDLKFLSSFQYQAKFGDKGAEKEICNIHIGRYDGIIEPNPYEVFEHRFFELNDLNALIVKQPNLFTPWFKIEWKGIYHNRFTK